VSFKTSVLQWLGHVAYNVDLHGVGFNTSVSDHEAQKKSGGYTELPLELSQVGECFPEVVYDLVLFRSFDNHIVYISFNVSPDLRL
jgi:hypothetical protein